MSKKLVKTVIIDNHTIRYIYADGSAYDYYDIANNFKVS